MNRRFFYVVLVDFEGSGSVVQSRHQDEAAAVRAARRRKDAYVLPLATTRCTAVRGPQPLFQAEVGDRVDVEFGRVWRKK